jgi:hypothetical protein
MSEWKESLQSEDLKAHATFEKFQSVDDLAKSYLTLEQKLHSSNKVELPGPDATPEQLEAFYSKLTPKEAKDYDIKFEDTESIKAQELVNDDLKAALKKTGLTNKQAQAVVDQFRGVVANKEKAIKEGYTARDQEQTAAFEKKYGSAKDAVKVEVDEYMKRQFGEDYFSEFTKTAAYKDPENFDKLLKFVRKNIDSGFNERNSSRKDNSNTKEELIAERTQFLQGRHPTYKGALLNEKDPANGAAKERMRYLQQSIATYES